MQLVATHEGVFFRAQSTNENEIEMCKLAMLEDNCKLDFEIMNDAEFELFLDNKSKEVL